MSALVEITDPQVFAEKMAAIADNPNMDIEESHARADDLMCELLRELGYGKGIEIFEHMDRWYA